MLKFMYETVAYVSENLVFVFLGMGLFAFDHPFGEIEWYFVVLTFLNLNIARFLNVLVCSWIMNKARKQNKISWKMQFVAVFSGLRGAMAYALAMQAAIDFHKNGKMILAMSLLYALFTILVQASFLNPVLDKCQVKAKDGFDSSKIKIAHGKGCCNNLKRRILEFDANYFTPLFIKAGRSNY